MIEGLLAALNPAADARSAARRGSDLLDAGRVGRAARAHATSSELLLGYLGEVSAAAARSNSICAADDRGRAASCRRSMQIANLVPQYAELADLSGGDARLEPGGRRERCAGPTSARRSARPPRPYVESIAFQDVYRDPERLGPGKKSLLFTLTLRSPEGTLTSDEADQVRDRDRRRHRESTAPSCGPETPQPFRLAHRYRVGRTGVSAQRRIKTPACTSDTRSDRPS